MMNIEIKTTISYEYIGDMAVTKVTSKAKPINISVTDRIHGDASPTDIADVVISQAETIRKVTNVLRSKQ